MKKSLLKSIGIFLKRLMSGRIYFSNEYSKQILLMEDGKKFQVLRDLRVKSSQKPDRTVALFKVRFKFSGLPMSVNKHLSMIPAPFLISKHGFREKIWTVSKDGYFQGLYEWSSEEIAEKYPESFIFKLMTKRSSIGTLSYEIISNTNLAEYINNISNWSL